jgi:hypothetical protein
MARGLGQRQKREKDNTIGRICIALYQEPSTLERLWKRTEIHKTTLVLRLNELVDLGIVKKTRPVFLTHYPFKGGFFRHNFYLLNCSKKESKEIISRALTGIPLADYLSQAAFRLNSVHEEGIGRVEPISFNRSLIRENIEKRVFKLDVEEKNMTQEILLTYSRQNQWDRSSQVVQKRDKILATLILACTQYYIEFLLLDPDKPWSHDFLISLLSEPLKLYDPPFRPYARVYEIMQLLGF